MTMGKTALFVYGTLKRGFSNHAMLAGQEFVGAARTLPRYRLLDHGPHPCLVEAVQAGRSIGGEIWNVDAATLDRLDEFEEVDHLFSRREIAPLTLPRPSTPTSIGATRPGCRIVWTGGRSPKPPQVAKTPSPKGLCTLGKALLFRLLRA